MISAFDDVCGNGMTGNLSRFCLINRQQMPRTISDNPPIYKLGNNLTSTLTPKNIEFVSYEKRLASFETPDWPTQCPVSPQLLAAAGLFYHGELLFLLFICLIIFLIILFLSFFLLLGNFKGHMDSVECYFCGKGICIWEPGDDPWSEHLRLSPSCLFLQDIKNKKNYEALKNNLTEKVKNSSQDATSNETSKQQVTINTRTTQKACDRLTCKICLEEELSILFLPCSHLISCQRCAVNLTNCPLCRSTIHAAIQAYIS